MGMCLAKIGSDSAGKFLCCLPLNSGCMLWGALWTWIGGLGVYNTIVQALSENIEHSWQFWLNQIVSSIAVILYLMVGIFWFILICKPMPSLKSLLLIMSLGNIITAILYWINCAALIADDTFTDEDWSVFYMNTVLYSVLILGVWVMMTNCKSCLAVKRVGGSGWERKSADEIIAAKGRTIQGAV